MYTPLKFMNQIRNMVVVVGNRKLANKANQRSVTAAHMFWSNNRAEKFFKTKVEWGNISNANFILGNYEKDIVRYHKYFASMTGFATPVKEDFLQQLHQYLSETEWDKNKLAYKIDNSMMKILCEMPNPDRVPIKALAYLPSKCFYIDYNGLCPFCPEAVGAFITYDIYNGNIIWSISNIVEDSRVLYVHTELALPFGVVEGSSSIDVLSNLESHLDLSVFSDEFQSHELETGKTVSICDRECIKFFINFCLYLSAANTDVEPEESTTIERKERKKNIKKNPNAVKSYNVGFRNGKRISASAKTIKQQYIRSGSESAKRSYSSCYRSAHWHSYWVKDDENPGGKKKIVKWVEGTFVRGNKESDSVVIHKVTE